LHWGYFEEQAPDLAALGASIFDRKIAYLATLKRNGAPRLHPVRPIVGEGHCFVFIDVTSPKRRDLIRDSRYALHGGVSESNGLSPEIMISGRAEVVVDSNIRTLAVEIWGDPVPEQYVLFEYFIEYALITEYTEARKPIRRRWRADR
jgi:hypothetical protein